VTLDKRKFGGMSHHAAAVGKRIAGCIATGVR